MPGRKRLLNIALAVLLIITLAFIWSNSLMDSEQSSQLSNGFLDWVRPFAEFLGIFFSDDKILRKLAHLAEYALLGAEFAALVLLNEKHRLRRFVLPPACCLAVAAIDELIQLTVGRYGHILDVMLDVFGGSLGAAFVWMLCLVFSRRFKQNIEKTDVL